MDCEVSESGIAGLHRQYQALIDAGLGDGHEWLDSEDDILKKVPLLPLESVKVSFPNSLLPLVQDKHPQTITDIVTTTELERHIQSGWRLACRSESH